jgi:hypothetical protein
LICGADIEVRQTCGVTFRIQPPGAVYVSPRAKRRQRVLENDDICVVSGSVKLENELVGYRNRGKSV